jgi:hypothetical protein
MSKEWSTYLNLAAAGPQQFDTGSFNAEEYLGSSDEEELERMGLSSDAEVLFDQEADARALGLIS